jgi:hypothetical protein
MLRFRLGADRREEIDEIAVGVAEEQGAVAPGHGRRRLDEVADDGLQPGIFRIDVGDAEFDDGAVIVGRARRTGSEQGDRARAADRQRAGRRRCR